MKRMCNIKPPIFVLVGPVAFMQQDMQMEHAMICWTGRDSVVICLTYIVELHTL